MKREVDDGKMRIRLLENALAAFEARCNDLEVRLGASNDENEKLS